MSEKKNIYQKLLEVKKEMGAIKKDKRNPFFNSNYADINVVIEQVEPILNTNGLVLIQPINDGRVFSIIVNADKVDEFVDSSIELPQISDPQKMGSAITYYRRYTLVSLLGLMTEDDDGNKASGKEDKPVVKKSMNRSGITIKDLPAVAKTTTPFKEKDTRSVLNEVNANWDTIVVDLTKADKATGEVILGKVKTKYQMDKNTLATLQKLVK